MTGSVFRATSIPVRESLQKGSCAVVCLTAFRPFLTFFMTRAQRNSRHPPGQTDRHRKKRGEAFLCSKLMGGRRRRGRKFLCTEERRVLTNRRRFFLGGVSNLCALFLRLVGIRGENSNEPFVHTPSSSLVLTNYEVGRARNKLTKPWVFYTSTRDG